MNPRARLPLGLDIGSTRVRLAQAERTPSGDVRLAAIVSRDLPEDAVTPTSVLEPELVAAIVEDLRHELGARERRCVLSLSAQAATVRAVRFPTMNTTERRQAARFEAERFAEWNTEEVACAVRLHPLDRTEHVYLVGAAREDYLAARVACAKRSGLRAVAVDHDACALRRAFPFADAVLDVGYRQSALYAFTPVGPLSLRVAVGGADITRAIAAELGVDAPAAERRKLALGTAGAGEGARDTLVAAANSAVASARERGPLRRIALTGNGSRLGGLAAALEAASGALVEVPVCDILRGGAYPEDVVRAAAPDWSLAAALATWSLAG